MIDYDGRFWNAYYLEAVKAPSARIMDEMGRGILQIQLIFRDEFTPVIRKAMWAIMDLELAWRLPAEPRWKRPWIRLSHRVRRILDTLHSYRVR